MNAKAAAILSDPQPCGHIVYPYTDEFQVAEAVCLFASAGLQRGEAVLLVMTEAHCQPILERIGRAGFDVDALTKSGQLICEEAEDLLSSFMLDGVIDEHVFKSKIGRMIERAKAAGSELRPVRVFGEMVSLIWQARPQATERLEELWNEVIQEQSVPLLCAYALAGEKPGGLPESLVACHSHALI
jgi:KaiC/GvpD/RAD55 family RecA-like ATPase